MPLHHFVLTVPMAKLDNMVDFLIESLQHMGFKVHIREGPWVGMGETVPYFWLAGIGGEYIDESAFANILKKQHIAFAAES